MKSHTAVILAIAAIVLATLACGRSSNSDPQVVDPVAATDSALDVQNDTPTAVQSTTPTAVPTKTPKLGTTRSNPAPVGSEVTADDMTFVITGTTRPADEIVKSGNMFNTEAETGKEYIFVNLNIICNKSADNKCSFTPMFSTKLIGSLGIEYDLSYFLAGVEGLLESTEFYGGATISGILPFIVGVGETDLILLYDPFLGSTFYLAVP